MKPAKYPNLFAKVSNRGVPPAAFVEEIVTWLKSAPADIFSVNKDPEDVYNKLAAVFGPWKSPLHRRAAMGVLLIILAGFESSWNWKEGVDKTNKTSMKNRIGQETGAWQVSYDSLLLDIAGVDQVDDLRQCVKQFCGTLEIQTFIDRMKTDHAFAITYVARLLRNSYKWDGPILRDEIKPWLKRAAVEEMITVLL